MNYYPDFLKTLEKANAFVERSGDSTLTTAFAIHQGMIEDILKVTGPVMLDGVPIAFDSDNFSSLMSVLVESQFKKDKTPKDILFAFVNAFSHKLFTTQNTQKVADIVKDYIQRGEIVAASRDPKIHQFLQTFEPPLPWETQKKNWIYPVFTSLSGNKSDRYISRTVSVGLSPV